MGATDAMVTRLSDEIDELRSFQETLIATAQTDGRDLTDHEMEQFQRSAADMRTKTDQLGPLQETLRIAVESANRNKDISKVLQDARAPRATPEYRSAGEYICDRWQAAVGVEDARARITVYERAAAHQTTADNAGIIPTPVVGGVINFIDSSRPVVSALGPQAVPGGMFKRPRVTQHTDVGGQTNEKTELVSRKMLIDSIDVTMSTIGGYVNVSRQNIDWSTPSIMDLIVTDLAAQYAIETETITGADLVATATPQTPVIAAGATAEEVAEAVWKAAGTSYAAMKGAGRLFLAVAPDMLGVIGPLFAPVNPQNSQSAGFSAGSFGAGVMGSIGGIAVVMSPPLQAGTILMVNTASEEVYEQRVGTLQVIEPSVLGVQVAYAGYFAAATIDAGGIIKLTA